MDHISIQTADFDVSQEIRALRAGDPRIGAVCAFVGTVRDRNRGETAGDVSDITLEHYPGMTEKAIARMIAETKQRFGVLGASVVHRIGKMHPEDQIVLVAIVGEHRHECFAACEFLMDYLKTQAPFWKKETTHGAAHWVRAHASDDAALARWGVKHKNAA